MKRSPAFLLVLLFFSTQQVTAQDPNDIPPDSVMEARMKAAWGDMRAFYKTGSEIPDSQAVNPQWAFAEEFLSYFRTHPDSPTGKKAAENAFMMWGNLESADEVTEAIQHVPDRSDVWGRILTGISNAYARSDRYDEYETLVHDLENRLTHPASRSALFRSLGAFARRDSSFGKAVEYYSAVVELDANAFDVQRAVNVLYELESLNVGQPAPDFTVETLDGESLTLSDLRGKVVLMEFWATSCGPCLPLIPYLKTLYEELPASEFFMIGITEDKDLDVVNRFLDENDMRWPQVQQLVTWDEGVAVLDEVLRLYNVFGIPRSFLIDRDGMIASKDLRDEELEKATRDLVASYSN